MVDAAARLPRIIRSPRNPCTSARKPCRFCAPSKRNNDREWFHERKDQYETLLKAPMVEVIRAARAIFGRLRTGRQPGCIYRIYRDTRFSDDKTPLKTNIAARFPGAGPASGELASTSRWPRAIGNGVGGGMCTRLRRHSPPPAVPNTLRPTTSGTRDRRVTRIQEDSRLARRGEAAACRAASIQRNIPQPST